MTPGDPDNGDARVPTEGRDARTIGGLLAELDAVADPHVRGLARDLVARLLEVHGAGLSRLLELAADQPQARDAVLRGALTDPRISSLLVLHDLHPIPRADRVARAVDEVAGRVGPLGEHLHLDRVEGDTAVIRVDGPAATPQGRVGLAAALEKALATHAPDVDRVDFVDDLEGRRRLPVLGTA